VIAPSDNPHHARRWEILGVLALAQLMIVVDVTIVNIALPTAQHALHFSDEARQWVVTSYALAFGSLLLLGGRLGDFFGRKRALLIGLLGFAAASAMGGLAHSFAMLIAARALQGAFAALLAPAVLSLLSTTFTDQQERGRAFGIYGAVAGGGAAVGLLLGGVLTSYLSWRWCLYVNVLIALPTTLSALALLHQEAATHRPTLDLWGAITAVLGLLALVYGFSSATTHGWGSALTLSCLAIGIATLAVFVVIERRVAHPLLPLRVVLDRTRGGSLLSLGAMGAGVFGVFLFLTYYLEQTLGFSPVKTGIAYLPMVVAISLAATLTSSVLGRKLGEKILVVSGMAIATAGMLLLTRLGVNSSYATEVLPALTVVAIGLGFVFPAATNGATAGIAPDDAGVGSAMVNTTQQIAGSIGIALLNTIATSAATSYLNGKPPTAAIAADAAVHGYTTAFWWTAAIFLAGTITALIVLRSPQRPHRSPGTPAKPTHARASTWRPTRPRPAHTTPRNDHGPDRAKSRAHHGRNDTRTNTSRDTRSPPSRHTLAVLR
jgi:EmrB/QacA subfamily drug resistance transporter